LNRLVLLSLLLLMVLLAACSDLVTLRADHPIQPVREYERMIVGRLDADYIGNEQCLSQCHSHDKKLRDFGLSVHGEQIEQSTGLPLVNCESCHGPGSLAVANAAGAKKCDSSTFLPLAELPSQAKSLICLKCHASSSSSNLQYWKASVHANSDVSCMECHKLHLGPQQKVGRKEMDTLCYGCHSEIRAAFSQPSHHPLPEGKIACIDCHDPHGTPQAHNLKGTTSRETCSRCHMEFQGPFVYEHADVSENCINCHTPHGSTSNSLLTSPQPFLCLQCHAGHLGQDEPSLTDHNFKSTFYGNCTTCHSAIHGTDVPSAKGRGTFIAR